MAIRHGASAIGLVSSMPSGPGVISEQRISEIAKLVPPGVSSFLLTSERDAASIVAQQRRARSNTVQICDRLIHGGYPDLREAMPGIALVQVVHVGGAESISEAVEIAPYVDGILLDSGNRTLPVKELGGTGRVHDWSISRRIRDRVNVPVYLAGGLNPDNVFEAIATVRPFGIDVCSGVRTDGKLDEGKLENFFQQVSAANARFRFKPFNPGRNPSY
jgi:phosphoribosylanthranilate isomerase